MGRNIKYSIAIVIFCCNTVFAQQKITATDSAKKVYYLTQANKYGYVSDEWQTYLDSAIHITPNDAQLWQQKAMPYFKCRKYEVGMNFLNTAVTLNPKEWMGYRAFIKCIFSKNYTDAIADYAAAERLNGNFTEMEHPYSFYVGISYLQLNEFDSAVFYLNKTITAESPAGGNGIIHFMDWFYLGIANYELKKYEVAINFFDKALLKYDHFSEAKYYKALSLFKSHQDRDNALQLFKEAKTDYKNGYSFTEDNCVYETYPYQLRKYMVR